MKKILLFIIVLMLTGCSGLYKVSDEEFGNKGVKTEYDGNKGVETEYDGNKGVETEYDNFKNPLLFHLLFTDMIAF